jgi:regulator of sigma E protease
MIHELGHFLLAKKNGVYVYEFCLGMGPKIFHKKKGETEYSIRLFPIGGFVSMAGEDLEEEKIPKERQLCHKSWWARFTTLIAGITFNILLAIVLLFIVGLVNGVPNNSVSIAELDSEFPIINTNIEVGDTILKVNNTKIKSYEMLALELTVHESEDVNLTVRHLDGTEEIVKVSPKKTEDGYAYGIVLKTSKKEGLIPAIQYGFIQTKNLSVQMYKILYYLVTGKLSLNSLSGPVGIYTIVGDAATLGFINILYLIAYLCINVAVINLIPFPAFDGGRILFLIIEKIKGSKVNENIENMIHSVGFVLLMILMIYVTYHDIIRLF